MQLLPEGPLGLYAQSLPGSTAINLLQGSYAPQSPLAGGLKPWRIAAAMLLALLVLHGIGSAAQLMMLKRTERRLDQSISETFEEAMPGEHNTSNARHRMEARLTSVQGSTDSSGLLAMLSAVAHARAGASGTALQARQLSRRAPGAAGHRPGSRCARSHQPAAAHRRLAGGSDLRHLQQRFLPGPHPDEARILTMDNLLSWFKAQSPRDQRVAVGAAAVLLARAARSASSSRWTPAWPVRTPACSARKRTWRGCARSRRNWRRPAPP